jgi:DUF2934 family protein
MNVSSESGPTKRSRTKSPTTTAAPKAERKTLTAKKKSAPPGVAALTPSPMADMSCMIATAAFYLAAERHFAPGHELDDWLEAERRVLGGIP